MVWDVIVVGLGPTGATIAHLLGMQGLKTLVLERDTAIHALPRAVHFDDEVMRIFQTIGVADQVAAVARINQGMRFFDAGGRTLLDWPRPQVESPQGWHPSYRFHQPDLDAILRDALTTRPTVEVREGHEVTGLRDHGTHVVVSGRMSSSGGEFSFEAQYVVGCDGARSLVRRAIGGGTLDLGFHERWLVVDMLLTRDKPGLGDLTIQHCDPAQPATYVRGPGRRRRWEIALVQEDSRDFSGTPAEIWRRLARWLTPDEAEIERAAVYTFHALIAEKWRAGRLLIAGDAAHQSPPFMGQGMCAGIRDAANLAWKLHRVINGLHDPSLLDSYASERLPHARVFIETAVKLGRLVSESGSTDDLEAAFRQPDGSVRMQSLLPPLGPGLADPADPLAGTLFPQPETDGVRMDDKIGFAPSILADSAIWAASGLDLREFEDLGIPVILAGKDSPAALALAERNTRAVLLRPDRYVLASARKPGDMVRLRNAISTGNDCPLIIR